MTQPTPANKPRKQAQQARAKRTVRFILEAAARILKRDGLAKVTTNRIAAEAGLSVGSVYQYYPNKQAILVNLMSELLSDAMATRPIDLDRDVSLKRRLEASVHWHLQVRREDPLLFQRLFEIQQEVLTNDQRTAFDRFHQMSVQRGLERHRSEIRIKDLETAALIVSQFILTATQTATAHNPSLVDDAEYEVEIVTALMAYLHPDGAD